MKKYIVLFTIFIGILFSNIFPIYAISSISIEWKVIDWKWSPMIDIPLKINDWSNTFYRITDNQGKFKFDKNLSSWNKFKIDLYNYTISFENYLSTNNLVTFSYDNQNNILLDYSPQDNVTITKNSFHPIINNYKSDIFYWFIIINFFLLSSWSYLVYTRFLNRPKKNTWDNNLS